MRDKVRRLGSVSISRACVAKECRAAIRSPLQQGDRAAESCSQDAARIDLAHAIPLCTSAMSNPSALRPMNAIRLPAAALGAARTAAAALVKVATTAPGGVPGSD